MTETLFAGFGRRDITPYDHFPNGMWMAQTHTWGEGLHRRLYTNCLIAGSQSEAVALLNYDLCILSPIQVAAIKAAVQKAIGLPEDRIWLYVTHNHATPMTQEFYNREGANEVRAYIEALPGTSADAAHQGRLPEMAGPLGPRPQTAVREPACPRRSGGIESCPRTRARRESAAWRLKPLSDDVEDEGETAVFLTAEQRKALIDCAEPYTGAFLRGLDLTGARPKCRLPLFLVTLTR